MRFVLILFIFHIVQASYAQDYGCFNKLVKENRICYIEKDYTNDKNLTITENLQRSQSLDCLSTPEDYIIQLAQAYTHLPGILKPAFCNIKILYITKQAAYGGAAGIYYDTENIKFRQSTNDKNKKQIGLKGLGFILKLNEERITKNETSKEYMERLLGEHDFPGNKGAFNVNIVDSATTIKSALFYTLVHEIGHFIDFSMGLNSFSYSFKSNEEAQKYLMGSHWSQYSWTVGKQFIYSYSEEEWIPKFTLTPQKIIFERNNGQINISKTLENLENSPFSSLYASRSPSEDFAEHFTYYVLSRKAQVTYNGKRYLFGSSQIPKNTSHSLKSEFIESVIDNISFEHLNNGKRLWFNEEHFFHFNERKKCPQ